MFKVNTSFGDLINTSLHAIWLLRHGCEGNVNQALESTSNTYRIKHVRCYRKKCPYQVKKYINKCYLSNWKWLGSSSIFDSILYVRLMVLTPFYPPLKKLVFVVLVVCFGPRTFPWKCAWFAFLLCMLEKVHLDLNENQTADLFGFKELWCGPLRMTRTQQENYASFVSPVLETGATPVLWHSHSVSPHSSLLNSPVSCSISCCDVRGLLIWCPQWFSLVLFVLERKKYHPITS